MFLLEPIPYRGAEIKLGVSLLLVLGGYALALGLNDFRLVHDEVILAVLWGLRVGVALAVLGVYASFRLRWSATVRDVLIAGLSGLGLVLEGLLAVTRPSDDVFTFVPTLLVVVFFYFLLPTRTLLKFAYPWAISALQAWMVFVKPYPADARWTILATILGINAVGVVATWKTNQLRALGAAYRAQVGDPDVEGADPGPRPAPLVGQSDLDVECRVAALPLSKRERQVVVGLVRGWSRFRVADELYVSDETIKTHVRNIYRKLGVASRTELVRRVYETAAG